MSRYINKSDTGLLLDMVKDASGIVIISHTNPDGDAAGSSTAMCNFLKFMGIPSTIILPDSYPDYLSLLDAKENIVVFSKNKTFALELIDNSDLIIAVDFNNLKRVSEMECHILDSEAHKILIDHHPFPETESFDLVISDTSVSSTCELIYWLIRETDVEITLDVANSLYVGMMTDTNNFSNSVTWKTFSMASDLLKIGVDKEKLQHTVFGGFSESRMRLMGHILLNKMVVLEKFGAAYITLSSEEQKIFEFNEGDSEGFVNLPLNIKGLSISALFTEKEDQIRVSLRSVNNFSVNKLSRLYFNGGGHERASGGKLNIPFEQVGQYFTEALEKSFNECMND